MHAQGWKQLLGGLLVASVGVLGGCEDRNVSLQIVQMEVDGQCLLESSGGGTATNALSEGTVDLAVTTNYTVFPRVTNNMLDVTVVNAFRPEDGRIDTHDVVLKEAVVQYETLDLVEATFGRLELPLSGTIPVNAGAVVGITVLTPQMIEELRQAPEFLVFDTEGNVLPVRTSVKLLLRITLKGQTLDGSSVDSNEFVFPLRVCNGCRVTYPPEAIDVTAPVVPNCSNLGAEDDETIGGSRLSCQSPGSDNNFVDCRECPGFAVDGLARRLCQPPVAPGQ